MLTNVRWNPLIKSHLPIKTLLTKCWSYDNFLDGGARQTNEMMHMKDSAQGTAHSAWKILVMMTMMVMMIINTNIHAAGRISSLPAIFTYILMHRKQYKFTLQDLVSWTYKKIKQVLLTNEYFQYH